MDLGSRRRSVPYPFSSAEIADPFNRWRGKVALGCLARARVRGLAASLFGTLRASLDLFGLLLGLAFRRAFGFSFGGRHGLGGFRLRDRSSCSPGLWPFHRRRVALWRFAGSCRSTVGRSCRSNLRLSRGRTFRGGLSGRCGGPCSARRWAHPGTGLRGSGWALCPGCRAPLGFGAHRDIWRWRSCLGSASRRSRLWHTCAIGGIGDLACWVWHRDGGAGVGRRCLAPVRSCAWPWPAAGGWCERWRRVGGTVRGTTSAGATAWWIWAWWAHAFLRSWGLPARSVRACGASRRPSVRFRTWVADLDLSSSVGWRGVGDGDLRSARRRWVGDGDLGVHRAGLWSARLGCPGGRDVHDGCLMVV